MKGSKDLALTFADKCKNIMASNWRGYLNTVEADAKGRCSYIKVMYFLKRGKPYLCVPQDDLHNLNVVIDECGSMAVANPYPGPLANVLKSIGKLPTRVALTGDVVSLQEEKLETIELEKKAFSAASYAVTEILSSSRISSISRTDNLRDVLSAGENAYVVYKFDLRSFGQFQHMSAVTDRDITIVYVSLSKKTRNLSGGLNTNRRNLLRKSLLILHLLSLVAFTLLSAGKFHKFGSLKLILSTSSQGELDEECCKDNLRLICAWRLVSGLIRCLSNCKCCKFLCSICDLS
ncbi:hypothetical protein MKW92_037569 [Papaver armeniacum]|nr:hypothetical protein MKW92_037569 [Papaver armeniacum]